MPPTDVALIIPFRDRGRDPLRKQNLDTVVKHWYDQGYSPQIFDDGREGDEQFNRSAAYNRAVKFNPGAQVFIFAESDMLMRSTQAHRAVTRARLVPGLVVPFTEYHYIGERESASIRAGRLPEYADALWIMRQGRAVGAINVVSRYSLEQVGQFDENFEGSWYDDRAMEIAFSVTCGPTQFIEGVGFHLYHQPGWQGDHLTDEDKAATARNAYRHKRYVQAETPEDIRALTMEAA